MGRRSDHTREELRELVVREGQRLMEEVGYARFSGREIAKRIGYAVGTITHVMGGHDALVLAVNARTLAAWETCLEERLARCPPGAGETRLDAAIEAYFAFARAHRNAWTAIYDFRLPPGVAPPQAYRERIEAITAVIAREVRALLPGDREAEAPALARSLLATVHGHCFFALNGTYALLGDEDPLAAAKGRVHDAMARAMSP